MAGPLTPQSGLVRRVQLPGQRYRTTGQLIRGVVLATYVTDDPDHPETPEGTEDNRIPTAVYCDVLCYSSIPGMRYIALQQVMVLQDPGGMHSGRIWKPRAATMDISQAELDVDGPSEVADMDGDHVLIGFIEGNPNEPVIIGGVPHPSRDLGNEERATGRRLRLKLEDGDPSLAKHHGTFWGVGDNGDWVLDSTYANDGTLQDGDGVRGHEQPPPDDGKGAQRFRLPRAAEHLVELVDHITDPDAPESVAHAKLTAAVREVLLKDAGAVWRVILAEGTNSLNLEQADADAILTLGDGAAVVAIADHLKTLYNSLQGKLNTFDGHTHQYIPALHPAPAPTATTGPSATVSAPSWDSKIESTHLLVPDES